MPVFDILKRLVGNSEPSERRDDDRLRAALGARVLVVDDSATIRAVLGKMLAQDGYEVLKAPDGENAVEMAQSQFPDLIFLDIVLPGMSGFAVLRALRHDTRTRTTPIIMMSGNQQATEQFYVQRFGADGFIKKPFGRAEVFHSIRSLVQAGRMRARAEVPPPDAIPEGISVEEWNAIPDVAMPDEAHAAAHAAPAQPAVLVAPAEVPAPAPLEPTVTAGVHAPAPVVAVATVAAPPPAVDAAPGVSEAADAPVVAAVVPGAQVAASATPAPLATPAVAAPEVQKFSVATATDGSTAAKPDADGSWSMAALSMAMHPSVGAGKPAAPKAGLPFRLRWWSGSSARADAANGSDAGLTPPAPGKRQG